MPQLIVAVVLIALYVGAVYLYFVFVVPVLAAVGTIAALGIMVYVHGGALKNTIRNTPRMPEKPEPALKQYFYSAAWHELRVSIERAHLDAQRWVEEGFSLARRVISNEANFITGPAAVGVFLAVAVSVIVAYVLFGTAILLHVVVLVVCVTVSAATVGVLRATELLSMAVRRIYLVCPSRDCHRRIALPVYKCPRCGASHHSLLPGSYGAVRRRCNCGESLPTLFLFGRNRIPAFCPHVSCGKPLNQAIGSARNVHIAVVGGPYVGKTAFLTAAMLEIRKKSAAAMTFPERADQMAFEAASERFAKGITVDKTGGASPNAMLVRVEDVRKGESLLYIYDAAGELYAGTSELRRQNFFTHAHAVALLVDPFSIESVRIDRAREITAMQSGIRASSELPQDVYARMVSTLREQRGGGSQMDVPLAIIVTKVDAAGIEREIESVHHALEAAASPKQRKHVDAIREWLLRHGEGNLVASAEHDFRRVRYFACSALGRMPSVATDAFVSRGVLAPFQWLAESNGVRLQ